LYNNAADVGHAGEQRRLGKTYENGEFSLATDLEAARTWYQKAA